MAELKALYIVVLTWYDESKVHQSAQKELEVFETIDYILESDPTFQSDRALVLCKPLLDQRTLLFAQPLRILWEVWNDEKPDQTHDARQHALKNKDPSPTKIPQHACGIVLGLTL